jgi:hypothetical protein
MDISYSTRVSDSSGSQLSSSNNLLPEFYYLFILRVIRMYVGSKGGSGIMVAQYNEEVAHWLRHQTYSSGFESGPLNVYTGQKPRQPVVLIEIEPNPYNNIIITCLRRQGSS